MGYKSYLKIFSSKLLPSGMGTVLAIFTIHFQDRDRDRDRSFSPKRSKDRSSKNSIFFTTLLLDLRAATLTIPLLRRFPIVDMPRKEENFQGKSPTPRSPVRLHLCSEEFVHTGMVKKMDHRSRELLSRLSLACSRNLGAIFLTILHCSRRESPEIHHRPGRRKQLKFFTGWSFRIWAA